LLLILHTDTNQTRIVKRSVPLDSFFNFFKPPVPRKEDEEAEEDAEDDLDERLELDYNIGEDIKEKLIPRAIDWYTGAALEYEEIDEDDLPAEYDDDFSEDEEEDDDDEDDDIDDETNAKPKPEPTGISIPGRRYLLTFLQNANSSSVHYWRTMLVGGYIQVAFHYDFLVVANAGGKIRSGGTRNK